ncbi:hypothetical protein GCM10027048_21940 [Hymenobacter coalescens]
MPHLDALLLPSPVGHAYYTTCYVLAFLLNQVLLLWEGHRRGYPLRPWLLLTTGSTLAFIVGTKLIAMSAPEWAALWQQGEWPSHTARSVLGGAVGGTLAGLVLRRWLGFGWHAFDAFALPMCAAYALQCVGCLLTGCCFGHLAPAGFWGVQYAPGTLPYLAQLHQGLIAPSAAHSLPVLPTQLYTGLTALLTGAILWLTRHRPWPGGSWRLLHLALLLAARFLIEFGRDPAGEQVGAALRPMADLPLKQVQWALLPLVLLAVGWWLWRTRARPGRVPPPEIIPPSRPLRNLLAVASLLAATALLGPGALTLPEMLVVKAALTVVLVLEVAALLHRGTAQPRRLGLPLGLASAVLLLTNQAPPPADSARARHSLTLSVGSSGGAYDEDRVVTPPTGCSGSGGAPERRAYYHRYAVHGGSAELTIDNPRKAVSGVGLGVWLGPEQQGVRTLVPGGPFLTGSPDSSSTRRLFSLNPYVAFHEADGIGRLYLDYRLGLHLGQLAYPHHRDKSFAVGRVPVLPDMLLRIGKPGGAFGQFETGYGPAAVGNYSARLGVGWGLRDARSSYVLAGVGLANHHPHAAMGFVSGRVQLGRSGFALEPYAATNFGRLYQLSGRLFYSIPLQRGR